MFSAGGQFDDDSDDEEALPDLESTAEKAEM